MPESSIASFILGLIVGALFSGLIFWAVKWALILGIIGFCILVVYAALTRGHDDT